MNESVMLLLPPLKVKPGIVPLQCYRCSVMTASNWSKCFIALQVSTFVFAVQLEHR